MDKSQKRNIDNDDDEIDLNQLFSLIGRGISNVIGFFVAILTTLFNGIILFLLFLRTNIFKIILGVFIGTLLGGIYQYILKTPEFESSMTLQPNFGSDVQLYKNINLVPEIIG